MTDTIYMILVEHSKLTGLRICVVLIHVVSASAMTALFVSDSSLTFT